MKNPKKFLCVLASAFLVASFTACTAPSNSSSDSAPDSDSEQTQPVLDDFYEISLAEGLALKTASDGKGVYEKQETEILGKTGVYAFSCEGWNGELQVAETALSTHNEKAPCATAPEVREYLEEKGYEYAVIDFALTEGAAIGVYTYLPMRANMTSELGGLSVKDGAVLSATGNLLPEFDDRIQVFKDGYRIRQGMTVEANVWYTVVVELQLDTEQSLYGLDSWLNVSLTNGNGTVYIGGARFYTNDTFAEDYGAEGELAPEPVKSYYEFGADEMIDIKGVENCYLPTEGEVYGKANTYTHIGNGWSTEIVAKETAFVSSSEIYHTTAQEARASCLAKGYQYVALTFALSEGASISVTSIIPELGTTVSTTGGMNFVDGSPLAYRPAVDTDEEKAFYKVYANGREMKTGETVSDGVWYTVVVKILMDTSNNKTGASTWLNVSFGALGNNKAVYVAGVRYYTDETFAQDYTAQA